MFTLKRRYKIKLRQLFTTAAIVLAFVTGCSFGQRLPDTGTPAPAPTAPMTSTASSHWRSVAQTVDHG